MPRNLAFVLLSCFIIYTLLQFGGSSFELSEEFNKTASYIINETDRNNIADILRFLSSEPHVGGTPAEVKTAEYVEQTWRTQGLDEVHLVPYEVLLSYPDVQKPNYVKILNTTGNEIWRSQGRSMPIFAKEEWSKKVLPDFNAFSPPGNVTGNLVFANFGSDEDFNTLDEIGVNVSGNLIIAKYGQVFRGNIASAAEKRGAIGVMLYPDPQQYAHQWPQYAYPDSVFMPGSAAPFGTIYLNDGDPQTPYYPSIESAFRIPENETAIPKIPVMPLSYNDASVILSKMSGRIAPKEWQGSLNLTYRLGPGFYKSGWQINMEVNTHNEKTKTYNVVAMMKGTKEPDRYVILGNHRDAWIFGAIDPSSGTAAMLELTRLLTAYRNETGWSPRRTLVFCSWGAEEYGLIGSQEWSEQFGKQLADRTIAYLNLDMAIEGNFTLRTKATPLLYGLGKNISQLVPNPDPNEVKEGRTSVFDTWLFRNPDLDKPGEPKFTGLGSGSDYKSFQHNLGIPSLEYRYTHSKEMFSEPLYHTLYETYYLVSELYDKGFHFHASITQLWGLMATYIADAEVLPFSLDEYTMFINEAQVSFFEEYQEEVSEKNITLDFFRNASNLFTKTAENYIMGLRNLNTKNPLALRRVNDQLMMVERAFIDPIGLPGRPFYNHVVFAPSSSDNYASTAFAGLSDALDGLEYLPEEEQESRWRAFEEHLAACTHLLLTASKVLSDDLW